jgi:hypothetical protein
MTQSITPPREMIEQWASEKCYDERDWLYELHIATRAAQWGADQELEACCEWLGEPEHSRRARGASELRAARRPKPPSLKEQAIAELDDAVMRGDCITVSDALPTIRRALEALPE